MNIRRVYTDIDSSLLCFDIVAIGCAAHWLYFWRDITCYDGSTTGTCTAETIITSVRIWYTFVPPTPTPTPTPTNTPTPTPTATPDADCSDVHVDLIHSDVYPQYLVQEAEDMQLVDSTGIYALGGPVINGTRLTSFSWGAKVKVYARAAFPQTGYSDQVWYQVGVANQSSPVGWILARAEDWSYVVGNDPCATNVTTISGSTALSFPYDRVAVRDNVVAQSYQNNISSPGSDRVTRELSGVRFANFVYSDLAGEGESTGSAMFVSEGIWMGGLPMRYGLNGRDDCLTVQYSEGGWQYCWIPIQGTGSATTTWRVHEPLAEYYTNASIACPNQATNTLLNPEGAQVMFPGSGGNPPTFTTDRLIFDDVNDFIGPVDSGGVGFDINEDGFAEFARLYLGIIRAGDYVWINSYSLCGQPNAGTPHGLLIVGWYTPIDCQTAASSTYAATSIYPSYDAAYNGGAPRGGPNGDTALVVPYVADFTSLQSPVPRPFYCTAWNQPSKTNFLSHDWFFFTLRDDISVPFGQIYVDPQWQWQ